MKKTLVFSLLLCHLFIAASDDDGAASSSSSSSSASSSSDSGHFSRFQSHTPEAWDQEPYARSGRDIINPRKPGDPIFAIVPIGPVINSDIPQPEGGAPAPDTNNSGPGEEDNYETEHERQQRHERRQALKILGCKIGYDFTMTSGNNFLANFFGAIGAALGKKIVNAFPSEEKEMEQALQNIQIRQLNLKIDAEAENVKFMKEVRENIAIIRKLNKKESGSELTEQEKAQREYAMLSLSLLQQFLNPKGSPAA